VPVIDTRNARTELLLKDGQVVVMGGLRRKEIQKQVKKAPLLGDLPLIGFLFRSTDTVHKNSELIVFLSPHVYKGEPIPEDAMAKYKKIVEAPVLSLPVKDDKQK
jgi:type II secretory pathway component GspD/PulD (secretin)